MKKIAVIGSGSAGLRHFHAIRSLGNAEPILISRRRSRLIELNADKISTATDIPSAVSRGVSAAIVATDTGRHKKDASLALQEGLDVLIEKPMAVNFKEACFLSQQAAQLNRRIHVGCVLRFSDSLNQFRKWLPEIGRLHVVEVECRSYLPDWRPARPYRESYSARAGEGGVLRDLIHEIDYVGWIFGWPTAVQARLTNLGRLEIASEEIAHLMWKTSGGALVSVGLDYLTRPTRRRMIAFGEQGTLQWDGVLHAVTLSVNGCEVKEFNSTQTRDAMFRTQVRAFLRAGGDGKRDVRLATGQEGAQALAVCDAARSASENRREEQVMYR